MVTKKSRAIEFGSNPFKFVGASYSKRMYALRKDPRAMLTIHLLFFVVWIKLPWADVARKDVGSKVISYGVVIGLNPFYSHINKGYK